MIKKAADLISKIVNKPGVFNIGGRTFERMPMSNIHKLKIYEHLSDCKRRYVGTFHSRFTYHPSVDTPRPESWAVEFLTRAKVTDDDISAFVVTCRLLESTKEPLQFWQPKPGETATLRFLPETAI